MHFWSHLSPSLNIKGARANWHPTLDTSLLRCLRFDESVSGQMHLLELLCESLQIRKQSLFLPRYPHRLQTGSWEETGLSKHPVMERRRRGRIGCSFEELCVLKKEEHWRESLWLVHAVWGACTPQGFIVLEPRDSSPGLIYLSGFLSFHFYRKYFLVMILTLTWFLETNCLHSTK